MTGDPRSIVWALDDDLERCRPGAGRHRLPGRGRRAVRRRPGRARARRADAGPTRWPWCWPTATPPNGWPWSATRRAASIRSPARAGTWPCATWRRWPRSWSTACGSGSTRATRWRWSATRPGGGSTAWRWSRSPTGINRLFANDLLPVRLAREAGLAAVERMPPLKRLFMQHAMGLVGDLPRAMRGGAALSKKGARPRGARPVVREGKGRAAGSGDALAVQRQVQALALAVAVDPQAHHQVDQLEQDEADDAAPADRSRARPRPGSRSGRVAVDQAAGSVAADLATSRTRRSGWRPRCRRRRARRTRPANRRSPSCA